MLILDRLENPGTTIQGNKCQFFTDGVMGGRSTGKLIIEDYQDKKLDLITFLIYRCLNKLRG